jgi:hypothetical protein
VQFYDFSPVSDISKKKIKIKELLVLGISKKLESKNQQFQVFQNPQRTVGFHERFTDFYTVFFACTVFA